MTQTAQVARRDEQVATNVDHETRERLFQLAREEDVSASAILRRALRRELKSRSWPRRVRRTSRAHGGISRRGTSTTLSRPGASGETRQQVWPTSLPTASHSPR